MSAKTKELRPFDVVEVKPPTGEAFLAIVARNLGNSGVPVVRLNETLQHHIVNPAWCKPEQTLRNTVEAVQEILAAIENAERQE